MIAVLDHACMIATSVVATSVVAAYVCGCNLLASIVMRLGEHTKAKCSKDEIEWGERRG